MKISTLILVGTLALGGLALAATTALPAFTPPPAPAAEDTDSPSGVASSGAGFITSSITLEQNEAGAAHYASGNAWWANAKVRLEPAGKANNFTQTNSTAFQIHRGRDTANGCDYTLSGVPENSYIAGYSFDLYRASDNGTEGWIVPAAGNVAYSMSSSSADDAVKVEVTNIPQGSQASFVLDNENNKGIYLTEFTVTLSDASSVTIVPSAGSFTAYDGTNGNFMSDWQSTDGKIKFSTSVNNIDKRVTDKFAIYSGRALSSTYTLASLESDKYVTAYTFKFYRASGDNVTPNIKPTAGNAKFFTSTTTSSGATKVTVCGLTKDSGSVFKLNDGNNKGLRLDNVTITLMEPITMEGMPVSLAGDICTLYKDSETTGVTWNNLWRRNEAPLASMSNGRNNIAAATTGTTGVFIATGQGAKSTTYIFDSGDDNKYIAGYTFKARRADAAKEVGIVAGGSTYSLADATTPVEIIVAGLAEPAENNTASFVLTSAENNQQAEIYDVVLYLKERTTPVQTPNYVFPSSSSRKYRIPAIATVGAGEHNGRLVAIGDYRYGHGLDIGGRIIDLNFAVSDNDGEIWTAPALLADAQGNILSQGQAGATFEMAYGDAAVTGDRESQKILVMACAGNIGYFGGAPGNYGAKFVSDDAGATWTKTEVTDQIKTLFADSQYGKLLSYFFGSGRLMQSRYVKVGEYYRVYGAISGRDNAGTSRNWILYTDDFGDTWHVLGDVDTPPVASGGDEPKCEELPDGSVLLSARRGGGRNFNIFRYTDPATGEGEWDGLVASSLNANTNGFNACDGEVMILPVRPADSADGSAATAYIALQSYPDSQSRDHITISWKLLETADDFKTTQAFVSEWDGRYLVYEGDAWYSTWSLDRNHDLAFLFERVVPGGAASLEHRPISISTITGGAWVYADDIDSAVENELTRQMLTARVEAAGLEEVLTAEVIAPACTPSQSWQVNASLAELAPAAALLSLNPEGPATRVGEYSKAAVDAFKADFNSIIADTDMTLIAKTEAIKALAAEVKAAEIVSGADYRVQNYGGNHQLLIFGTETLGFANATDDTPDEAIITFKQNGDNWELWQGNRTVTSELAVGELADGASAVAFRIEGPATTFAGAYSISNTAKTSQAALHINNNSRLIYWNAADGNNAPSFWYLSPVFDPAIAVPEGGLKVTRGESITVRLVENPVRGCDRFVILLTHGVNETDRGFDDEGNFWTYTVPEEFEGTSFEIRPEVNIGGIDIVGEAVTVTVIEPDKTPSVEPQIPEEAEGVEYTVPSDTDDPDTEDVDETLPLLTIALDNESAPAHVHIPAVVKNTENPGEHFEFRYDGAQESEIAAAEFVSEGEEGSKTHKIKITHKNTNGLVTISLHRINAEAGLASRADDDEPSQADDAVWRLQVKVTGAKPATEGIATSISLTGSVPSQLYLNQSFTVGAAVEPAESTDAVEWTITASPEDAIVTTPNSDGTWTVTAVKTGTVTVKARLATHAADAVTTEATRTVTLRNATGNPGQGVTGIETVNADAAEGRAEIYDLSGRRLTRVNAAGVYIVNGRKTIVR